MSPKPKSALAPLSGLPTETFASAGIGASFVTASSAKSNARPSVHSMPVSSLENAMPVGTPVNSLAEYSLANTLPSTAAVAMSLPCLSSLTVTVTLAVFFAYATPGMSPATSVTVYLYLPSVVYVIAPKSKAAALPSAGLPTVTLSLPSFAPCGIGALPSPVSVNSKERSAGQSMPVSCLMNVMPSGTPPDGCAPYALTNAPSVTTAVASSWPLPLSRTVTVTVAECPS